MEYYKGSCLSFDTKNSPTKLCGRDKHINTIINFLKEVGNSKILYLFIYGCENSGRTSALKLIKEIADKKVKSEDKKIFFNKYNVKNKEIKHKVFYIDCLNMNSIDSLIHSLNMHQVLVKKMKYKFKVKLSKLKLKFKYVEAEMAIDKNDLIINKKEKLKDILKTLSSKSGSVFLFDNSYSLLKDMNYQDIIISAVEEITSEKNVSMAMVFVCCKSEFQEISYKFDSNFNIDMEDIDKEEIKNIIEKKISTMNANKILDYFNYDIKYTFTFFDYIIKKYDGKEDKYQEGKLNLHKTELKQEFIAFVNCKYNEIESIIRKQLDYNYINILKKLVLGELDRKEDIQRMLGIDAYSVGNLINKLLDVGLISYKNDVIRIKSKFIKYCIKKMI